MLHSAMESHHLGAGLIYIVLPVVFVPFQIRIIYIFLTQVEFKSLECYRIMAMISTSNVLYGLCFVLFGITIMTQSDLRGFTLAAFKLWAASWAAILALDLALAVNRLRLVCQIDILWLVSKYLPYVALLYPVFFFVIMMTPWTGVNLLNEKVYFGYDFEKPLSKVVSWLHGYHNIFCVTSTAVIYISMSIFLLIQKCRYHSIGMAASERLLVIQAIIKFLFNMVVLVTMNFFSKFFQQSFWVMTAIPIFQIFNLLVLPLIVYIGFNRKLQRLYFRKKLNVWASSVSQINVRFPMSMA